MFLKLDFGHSGIDPLQTKQERAGTVPKFGEVWWGGRHHAMTPPPMPLQLSPQLAAIFLLSGCGENGQSRVTGTFFIELTAILTIIFGILILGLLGVLGTREISPILAAIAGYVLGKTTSNQTSQVTGLTLQPASGQTPSSSTTQS